MNRREFTRKALAASALLPASALASTHTASATKASTAGNESKAQPLASSHSAVRTPAPSTRPGDPQPGFVPLFNGRNLDGFVDMNTSEETWKVEEGILVCSGWPIGVMRTERMYENFILDIEWRFMEEGGNSGFFVWADGIPHGDQPFPVGMEIQMLDPAWAEIHNRPVEYVHGHLFPVMGLQGTIADNPSVDVPGRSYALEKRMNRMGNWNRYIVVCVDGSIKLSVNGRFVNGMRSTKRKKGYICPESEGAEIHFRRIDIMELPSGVITPDQIALQAP